MTLPILDTNVLLRAALQDHPVHSPLAERLLKRIERNEVSVFLPDTAVFETVFVLQKFYKLPRQDIKDILAPFLQLSGVEMEHRSRMLRTLDMYVTYGRLSFADCCHAAIALETADARIYSFDEGFDRIPNLTRLAPAQ